MDQGTRSLIQIQMTPIAYPDYIIENNGRNIKGTGTCRSTCNSHFGCSDRAANIHHKIVVEPLPTRFFTDDFLCEMSVPARAQIANYDLSSVQQHVRIKVPRCRIHRPCRSG